MAVTYTVALHMTVCPDLNMADDTETDQDKVHTRALFDSYMNKFSHVKMCLYIFLLIFCFHGCVCVRVFVCPCVFFDFMVSRLGFVCVMYNIITECDIGTLTEKQRRAGFVWCVCVSDKDVKIHYSQQEVVLPVFQLGISFLSFSL